MNLLKKIPIRYIGELHDVRLINFSVELAEIKDKVPDEIKIREFGNRALISMVDVKLKKMHPSFLPSLTSFDYRHIAFRLLVDDSIYNQGDSKGIYFYESFTDKPLVVLGGKCLTNYNLQLASIEESENRVLVSQDNNYITYCVGNKPTEFNAGSEGLFKMISSIDRAYAMTGKDKMLTIIQREKWPIQLVDCWDFQNTFFKTAKLEGAFRVFETIYYNWLPPKKINQ